MAPWLGNLAKLFAQDNTVDLHVVSPNSFTNKDIIFSINNITYHLFKFDYPFKDIRYYNLNPMWIASKKVSQIVIKINPDIVHLHGVENAYYSSTILKFIGFFPTLISIQGFVSNSSPNRIQMN